MLNKEELKDFIEVSFEEIFYSKETQKLLNDYVRDVMSSIKAIKRIPGSYFEDRDIKEQGHLLIEEWTENVKQKIGDYILKKIFDDIDMYIEEE